MALLKPSARIELAKTADLNIPYFVKSNYHSHYDDDDADFYYYTPATRQFTHKSWTTRFACGCCPHYDANELNVFDLIDAGVVDGTQFIDDLIAEYGVKARTSYDNYPTGPMCSVNFGLPVEISIRDHKGTGLLLYIEENINTYGYGYSYTYSFIDKDGNYFESTSDKFEIDQEKFHEAAIKRLHEVSPRDAAEFVLPWNAASQKSVYPIVAVGDLADKAVAYSEERTYKKFDKKRDKYVANFKGAYGWSVKTFGSARTHEEHLAMAKKLFSRSTYIFSDKIISEIISALEADGSFNNAAAE